MVEMRSSSGPAVSVPRTNARSALACAVRAAAAAAALAAAGCPHPTPDVALTVRFETDVDGNAVEPGKDGISLGDGVDVGAACLWIPVLRVVGDATEVEDDTPFALSLLDAAAAARPLGGAPPGLYSVLHFEARPVAPDRPDLPCALAANGIGYSIRITGHVDGTAFDYQDVSELLVDRRKLAPLELAGGDCATFLVRIDLARWLDGVDFASGELVQGVILVDATHNTGLLELLRAGLAADGTVTVEGFPGGC